MNERKRSPLHVDDQDYPEPERMVTPDEEAGMDIAELEDPPQAEGSRELAEQDDRLRDVPRPAQEK